MVLEMSHGLMSHGGIESAHSFSFKLGSCVTQEEWATVDQSIQPKPGTAAAKNDKLAAARLQARYEGLTSSERKCQVAGSVYCCVKTYMRDLHLQQPPIFCAPAGQATKVFGPGGSSAPKTLVPRKALSGDEIKHCLHLAEHMDEDFGWARAAEALRDHARNRDAEIPQSPWLAHFHQPCLQPMPQARSPHFSHLPASSWKLIATTRDD